MNTLFPEYKDIEIKTIFRIGDRIKLSKTRPLKTRNERQVILNQIQIIIEQENGAPMDKKQVQFLCFKLSHIPTKDLYFLLSDGRDYARRTGNAFGRYVFGSIKSRIDKK